MPAAEIRLRGAHNRENAMAAAAVCLARGVDAAAVREGLATFAGVPHRLEEVGDVDGVTYVNDSKATNVASAEVAHPLVRRRRPPDRRRSRQGLGLRAARRRRCRSAAPACT